MCDIREGGTGLAKKTQKIRPAIPVATPDTRIKIPVWIYIAAFFIPAVIVLIAYAAFDIYPFGERSVLALDLNGQYIYYFEALRDALWGDGSIFYNWSRNLSGEFMGIIGYYLASPFTLIVMLLPRTMILESMMIMQLCKIGSAGLTFMIYATRSKKVQPLQSLLFSTMYALMGYAVIQLIDPMWIDGIVFLPLIMLGIEYLIDDGRKINYIIPLAVMFVANFYIGFMIAIFVAIYFFFYLFFGSEKKFRGGDYSKIILRMGLSTVVVLMCSAIMILPVYNALSLGKFDFSGTPDYSFKTQFSPIELVPTLFPNQYYSVNMQGLPEIYCGVLSLVLLPLFYINTKVTKKRKIGYSAVILILLTSMYIKPIDMMWHGGQTPNWLPYRYSFLLSFIFVSMAAEIFSKLDGYKLSMKNIGGTFAGITVVVLIFNALMKTYEYSQEKFKYVAVWPYTTEESFSGEKWTEVWLGTIAFGLMLAAFYLVMLYFYSRMKDAGKKRMLTLAMAAVVFFEAGYNAYDSFKKVNKEVAYSNRSTYYNTIQAGRDITRSVEEYDREHGDNKVFRAEKTFFRTVNDNLAYGLKGISHSSSVMNTRMINFIETMGYSMRSYVTRYDGNTPLSDSLLGIRYVISDPEKDVGGRLNPNYNEIFTQDYIGEDDKEGTFHVYENPDALSVGYMVSSDIKKLDHLGNDNPFNSQNMFLGTLTGNTRFTETSEGTVIDGTNEYFTRLPENVVLSQCTESPYGDQRLFTADADAVDPVVNIHITTQSDDDVFMYLKTLNEKAVNLWISDEKSEDGQTFINHRSLGSGSYYENHDYSIVRLGSFPAGTDIEVRLTIRLNQVTPDTEEYTIIKDFFFYQFNDELFRTDIDTLRPNQWKITDFNDRHVEGTINAAEGQVMFTSIPSEPGWTVKVDGEEVETFDILNAFIGINLSPGEHTVSMTYTPPGFVVGVITLIFGAGIIILLYLYDRKHNKILVERRRNKELRAKGLSDAEISENSRKKVRILAAKENEPAPDREKKEAETGKDPGNKQKGDLNPAAGQNNQNKQNNQGNQNNQANQGKKNNQSNRNNQNNRNKKSNKSKKKKGKGKKR